MEALCREEDVLELYQPAILMKSDAAQQNVQATTRSKGVILFLLMQPVFASSKLSLRCHANTDDTLQGGLVRNSNANDQ